MKEKTVYAASARTKYANTRESDQIYRVVCVVKLSDGREIDVVATDPMDAIQQVERQLNK